jgi:hypothetical protein
VKLSSGVAVRAIAGRGDGARVCGRDGAGVGVSTNFMPSSVSTRAVAGVAAGSGGCGAAVRVAVVRPGGGVGTAELRVGVRAAVGVDVGVDVRAWPGSDCARGRVAAGVLVPSSGNAVVEYDVGEAVLVRDANGELVVRLPGYGAVVLRATAGGAGCGLGGDWLSNVTVPAANGGSVPGPASVSPGATDGSRGGAAGRGDVASRGRVAVRACTSSRGTGVRVRPDSRGAVGAGSRSVVVRDVTGSRVPRAADVIGCVMRRPVAGPRGCGVAVRVGMTHAMHDTSE